MLTKYGGIYESFRRMITIVSNNTIIPTNKNATTTTTITTTTITKTTTNFNNQ